jgi:3-oxoacyl-(acyl-carrier-protein) synthase
MDAVTPRRVAITRIGVVSQIGRDVEDFWQGEALSGRSAVRGSRASTPPPSARTWPP